MDINKVGKNIVALRKKKGLTQQELGAKLFVTDKAVSKWERGIGLPDISILEKLAEVLDTDIYELLQIENKKNIKVEKILEEERYRIKKKFLLKIVIALLFVLMCVSMGLVVKNIIYKPSNEKVVDNLKECVFIKTYRVENILQSNDEDYLLLTIREFNCEEAVTIRVNKNLSEDEFVEGNNYEFTLKRIKEIKEDNVNEIFDSTEILAIKETDKIGLDQVQGSPTCE